MSNTLTMPAVNVTNFESSNGNTVPNQFLITTPNGRYFKSYSSMIAYEPKEGKTILDSKYWKYSKTTGKYRNQFLNETQKETQTKIDNGTYILADLNLE